MAKVPRELIRSHGDYAIKFTVHDDPDDEIEGIVEITGDIRYVGPHGDADEHVGEMEAFIIEAFRGDYRSDTWSACDAHSPGASHLWTALFDIDTHGFKPSVEKALGELVGVTGEDVLHLDKAQIVPAHRGKGIGLWAAYEILRTFGRDCVIATCQPASLPDEGAPELSAKEIAAAKRKLARYWRQLGFVPFGKEGFMGLNLDAELVSPIAAVVQSPHDQQQNRP